MPWMACIGAPLLARGADRDAYRQDHPMYVDNRMGIFLAAKPGGHVPPRLGRQPCAFH